MDAPGGYQKAAWIDFTTRCLAYVFGESWAPAQRLAFGQQSLRMVRTKRNFRRAELRSLRSTREDEHDVVFCSCNQIKRDYFSKTRVLTHEHEWKAHYSKKLRTKTQNKIIRRLLFGRVRTSSLCHVRIRSQRYNIGRMHQRGARDADAVVFGSDPAHAPLNGSRHGSVHGVVSICRCR